MLCTETSYIDVTPTSKDLLMGGYKRILAHTKACKMAYWPL